MCSSDLYDVFTSVLAPTNKDYLVTLSNGNSTIASSYSKGITMEIKPNGFLKNDTNYNFNYTIGSTYWTLSKFGFDLKYSNGTDIGSVSSSSGSGGTVSLNALTGSSGGLTMNYYYLINNTYTNGTVNWFVYKENGFSIEHFITDAMVDIDINMFGVQGNDNGYFFKAVLSIFILITITGILSMRYGIASQPAISGILFGVLLFMNSIGLIPTPAGTTFKNLGDFIVSLVGILLIALIFKEENR